MTGPDVPTGPVQFPPHQPPLTRIQGVELLMVALDGVALGPFDEAVVRRLADQPTAVVRTVASLFARARTVGWPPEHGLGTI